MRTFQIELSPSVPSSGTSFTSGEKVSGVVVLTASKHEAVGTVDIIFRGRTKSQVTIEGLVGNGERSYTTYRGRATLFEYIDPKYIEPLHRGYPGHFTLPGDRHEQPFEFIFPDTALPAFGAAPWTESAKDAHRPGHALPPSFSATHDHGRN